VELRVPKFLKKKCIYLFCSHFVFSVCTAFWDNVYNINKKIKYLISWLIPLFKVDIK